MKLALAFESRPHQPKFSGKNGAGCGQVAVLLSSRSGPFRAVPVPGGFWLLAAGFLRCGLPVPVSVPVQSFSPSMLGLSGRLLGQWDWDWDLHWWPGSLVLRPRL